MNVGEAYRDLLGFWCRTAGTMFPRLRSKIRKMLDDPDATEADYATMIGEVNRCGGPKIGVSDGRAITPPTKPAVEESWPRQADVARGLDTSKTEVGRMIERGDLLTNGETGHACRVNPASVLSYCQRMGVAWNDSVTEL